MTKFSKPTDRKRNPIEAYVGALQDAQTYIAKDNAADAERLAALEKQVKEIQEKLVDVVTKEEFDSLAKEAVDTYVQSADLLKDYAKKTDLPDLAEYVTQEEIAHFITEKSLEPYAKKDDVVTIDKLDAKANKTDLDAKVEKELEGTEPGDVAKIQNQTDGGVMQYVSADKSNSAVTVNDGSQGVGAEICSLDPDGKGSRIIANKTGAYYAVGNTINVTPEKEIAVKGDLRYQEIKSDNGTAILFNEKDGGGAKFINTKTGIESFVGVNDGVDIPELAAQIYADKNVNGKWQGAKIDVTNGGIYYTVGDKSFTERKVADNEIAVKGDLNKFIPINNNQNGNKSYMANEKDGGIIKYIKPDESYAKVTLCNVDEEAVAQIVATNKDKTTFAKIDARKDGICYSKKTGNPNLEEDEIVVKKDLKVYTPAEMEGLNPGDTAVCHNAKDGGSIKYMTETHTAFVGVDNGGDELFAEFALAENKQGKEFKKGNRLLAKKDGIFYTKDANSTTTAPEDEIITKKDITNFITEDAIAEKADKDDLKKYTETKLIGDNGTALIFNEKDGGGAKFEAADGIESFVGVNDGKSIPGLYAQIYADKLVDGKYQGAKIDVTNEGIYYTVGNKSFTERKVVDNEIATKGDLKELALKTQVEQLQQTITQLQNTVQQLQEKVNTQ